jgi:hypothetical protein
LLTFVEGGQVCGKTDFVVAFYSYIYQILTCFFMGISCLLMAMGMKINVAILTHFQPYTLGRFSSCLILATLWLWD